MFPETRTGYETDEKTMLLSWREEIESESEVNEVRENERVLKVNMLIGKNRK